MRSTGPVAALVSSAVNVVLVSPKGTDSGPRRFGRAAIGTPRMSAARPGGRFERPATAHAFARCDCAKAANGTGSCRRGVRPRRPQPTSRSTMSADTAATGQPARLRSWVLKCESHFPARAQNVLPSEASQFSLCPTPRRRPSRLTRWSQRMFVVPDSTSVELPGIELGPEIDLTCENIEFGLCETTRKYAARPADTPKVLMSSTPAELGASDDLVSRLPPQPQRFDPSPIRRSSGTPEFWRLDSTRGTRPWQL